MAKNKKNVEELKRVVGKDLSDVSCLMASGIMLAKAGEIAERNNDAQALLMVAKAWYGLSQHISKVGDEEESESSKNPLGFICTDKESK